MRNSAERVNAARSSTELDSCHRGDAQDRGRGLRDLNRLVCIYRRAGATNSVVYERERRVASDLVTRARTFRENSSLEPVAPFRLVRSCAILARAHTHTHPHARTRTHTRQVLLVTYCTRILPTCVHIACHGARRAERAV